MPAVVGEVIVNVVVAVEPGFMLKDDALTLPVQPTGFTAVRVKVDPEQLKPSLFLTETV